MQGILLRIITMARGRATVQFDLASSLLRIITTARGRAAVQFDLARGRTFNLTIFVRFCIALLGTFLRLESWPCHLKRSPHLRNDGIVAAAIDF